MSVLSIYVEKKSPYATEAKTLQGDILDFLNIKSVTSVRILNRYFVQGVTEAAFEAAKIGIFSSALVDSVYSAFVAPPSARVLAVAPLSGQYDQRADACSQCLAVASGGQRPTVRTAKIYLFEGDISDVDFAVITSHLVNPVESQLTALEVPTTLELDYGTPSDVERLIGFTKLDEKDLADFGAKLSLAMDFADLSFCQKYFADTEKRDPSITEIRMIDTYWSDHCRHTTFLTEIDSADITCDSVKKSYDNYITLREKLYSGKDKPITLMDMATIGAKTLKKQGLLNNLDESEEINACSVKIKVDVNGVDEDWLFMFKNETHNHPTEIEPFGGASTCLGGAIRDPLSGRSYVYQAMRITGAGDPFTPFANTVKGKLPQRKLCQTAATGYSSYGNQIGLTTGLVQEIYHPGYVAKRMELGAVVGAAPACNVVREVPCDGDIVILLGAKTGRDGCGGATGSSKSHSLDSSETCSAQVQKGNAPEERKIQRLFRNPAATTLIKRCNDFGAGGVSVSIGELADGLLINLDAVPTKYPGLDGTELAISESQERMSVVIAKENVQKFIALSEEENLDAVVVASVTKNPRLVMQWRGDTIVDLSREFLNSNGATKHTTIAVAPQKIPAASHPEVTADSLCAHMSSINVCSQKGLASRFDFTAGGGTVLMPYGGKFQLTPVQVMAAKIPVLKGETDTCSVMAWGFDPNLFCQSTYYGSFSAVVDSVAKLIAAGANRKQCWLTFQEYFESTGTPERWGKPAAALLGALDAQLGLGLGSIGGKDSMSGTFEDIDVPPTLVSFAVSIAKTSDIISTEFKKAGSSVYLLKPKSHYDAAEISELFDTVEKLIASGKILSAWAVGTGGTAQAVTNMCFGNSIGFDCAKQLDFDPATGGFILEADAMPELEQFLLGKTIPDYILRHNGEEICLKTIQTAWENTLETIYPTKATAPDFAKIPTVPASKKTPTATVKSNKPNVLIPIFPGTSSEEETAYSFEKAGGVANILILKNRTPQDIAQSVKDFVSAMANAQILALAGGLSCGDEPDGAAKFITAFLTIPACAAAIDTLLNKQDGLICGIGNGFQALVSLGLLPYGKITPAGENACALAPNTIGRHQAGIVPTRVVGTGSPWLSALERDKTYLVPISCAAASFVADEKTLSSLWENGQVASVYVDDCGTPTADIRYNTVGSFMAIEGLTSPDGRVFGKMGHCEHLGDGLYKNIPNVTAMDIFKGGIDYFTK